jgi:type I protein arginine methyltransferase
MTKQNMMDSLINKNNNNNENNNEKSSWATLSDQYFPQELRLAMARDEYKMSAYKAALERAIIKGVSVVIDVGAGNGALSILAAHLGARLVYAVEVGRSAASELRRRIAFEHDRGHIPDAQAVRVLERDALMLTKADVPEQADVIVSDWLGYGLFHEHIWPAVCHVRDTFLKKPGGSILPSRGVVQVAGVGSGVVKDYAEMVSPCPVTGQDFSIFRDEYYAGVHTGCQVGSDGLVTREVGAKAFDFMTAGPDAGDWTATVRLPLPPGRSMHGLMLSWKVYFEETGNNFEKRRPIATIDTGHRNPHTHWGQALVLLDVPIYPESEQGGGKKIEIRMAARNPGPLETTYDITLRLGTTTWLLRRFM